jgi:hypothetical protein
MIAFLWILFLLLLALTVGVWLDKNFAIRVEEFFFRISGEKITSGLSSSLLHASAVWLITVLIFHLRKLKKLRWQGWCLAMVLVLDLFVTGMRIQTYAPKEFFTNEPQIVPLVRTFIDEGRLFRTPNPSGVVLNVISTDIMWQQRWSLEILSDYFGLMYSIPLIFHPDLDAMVMRDMGSMKRIVDVVSWEERLPVLSLSSVKLILTAENLNIKHVQPIARIRNASNFPFYLYENQNCLPVIRFPKQIITVKSETDALKMMVHPKFDPDSIIVNGKENSIRKILCENSQVQVRKKRFNSTSLSVSASCDTYLAFSQPFNSGWKVYLDGKRVPLIKANYAFSAVMISRGEHVVEKKFLPDSVILGAIITILATLMVCIHPALFLSVTG